ncbi:MAG TPA: hypothetical protein VG841_06915 [Caulobacterales bacterium]|nr:hypothetical protein [Caulobacterales bacterium]
MSRLILAHAPGDEATAERVAAGVRGVSVLVLPVGPKTRPPVLGPGVLLGLIWSHHAASSPASLLLAQFATGARGAFVIHADETLPSAALAELRLISTPAHATTEDVAAAMRTARLFAAHRAPQARALHTPAFEYVAADRNTRPSYSRMFVSGMTRGLASSLAVVGVGGGITFGIQESAGLVGASSLMLSGGLDAHAAEPQTQTAVRVRVTPGLMSDMELRTEAATLRALDAAQKPRVGELLTIADHDLADARARTERILDRLRQIADEPTPAQRATVTAATPAPELRAQAQDDAKTNS